MTRHGIATEKFSHLVIVGTHDHVLLDGDDDVEMTNDRCDWTSAGASLHGCMNPQYLALNGGTPMPKAFYPRTADCHNLIDAEGPALSLQQRRPSATSRVRGSGYLSPRDDVLAWPGG